MSYFRQPPREARINALHRHRRIPGYITSTGRELNTGTGINMTNSISITAKPQKLAWYYSGSWWAILYDSVFLNWYVWERQAGGWVRASGIISSRAASRMDAAFDGSQYVYVAEAHATQNRMYKLEWDSTHRSWNLILQADTPGSWAGSSNQSQNVSVAIDTNNRVWCWHQNSSARIMYYVQSQTDLSALQADTTYMTVLHTANMVDATWFNDGTASTGAFFSDIDDVTPGEVNKMYFVHHHDSDAITTFQTMETVIDSTSMGDDHPNIMANQTTGELYVSWKTSYPVGVAGNPNVVASRRSAAGAWDTYAAVWMGGEAPSSDEFTRPRIVYFSDVDKLMCVAYWQISGNAGIKYKTSVDTPQSWGGSGTDTTVRTGTDRPHDCTVPKLPVTNATKLLLLSQNDAKDIYVDLLTMPAPASLVYRRQALRERVHL